MTENINEHITNKDKNLSISIVTPNFNAVRYLSTTIESVISQNYSNLQYVIIDGGSTDGSVDVIKRYESDLHYWRSCPDGGLYDAVEIGFAHCDAEIMGWINSDDTHLPWTLKTVDRIFRDCPEVCWLTTETPLLINGDGMPINVSRLPGICADGFYSGENIYSSERICSTFIQQESTFWRRSLWQEVGGFDRSMRYAGDFALWSRFFTKTPIYTIKAPLAAFRRHGKHQISTQYNNEYVSECWKILQRNGVRDFDQNALIRRSLRSVGLQLPSFPEEDKGIHYLKWDTEKEKYISISGNVTQY